MKINLIELFHSIQGESSLTGIPTTFIRLASCNLRCSWCDTPYSFGRGITQSISEIVEKVKEGGLSYVCITGGEPLLQNNVHLLMKILADEGYQLSLETGGSLPIQNVDPRVRIILDIKCPGSGMSEKNDWSNLDCLAQKDEVKFVIADRQDYDYAVTTCEKYSLYQKAGNILFSPVFNILEPKLLVAWILQDKIPVRTNLQIHKFIWTPETRGV